MPRPSVVTDPDTSRPVLPIRVATAVDIEFCARALALEHGRPNRKVGKHRVREAVLELAAARIHQRDESEVPETVLEEWRSYLVHDLGEFPVDALEVQ